MTLMRWQRPEWRWPLEHWSSLRDEIDRLFDAPLGLWTGAEGSQPFLGGWCPAIDVYEDKDNLYVRAEVPGMKREDINLSLHEGVLTLSGERKERDARDSEQVYRSERFVGRFQRSLTLASPVDAEKVKAVYQDGILAVTLPKTEAAKPKQIQVKQD